MAPYLPCNGELRVIRRFKFKQFKFIYVQQIYKRVFPRPGAYYDHWEDVKLVDKTEYLNYRNYVKSLDARF